MNLGPDSQNKATKNQTYYSYSYYKISKKGYPDSYLFGTIHHFSKPPINIWESSEFTKSQNFICEMVGETSSGYMALTVQDKGFKCLARYNNKKLISLETMEERKEAFTDEMLNRLYNQSDDEDYITRRYVLQSELPLDSKVFKSEKDDLYYYEGKAQHNPNIDPSGVTTRNYLWLPRITSNLRDTSFIVVGAGHLPGPEGIVSLLEKQGFNLAPMPYMKEPRESLDSLYKPRKWMPSDAPTFKQDPVGFFMYTCDMGCDIGEVKRILELDLPEIEDKHIHFGLHIALIKNNTKLVEYFLSNSKIKREALLYAARVSDCQPNIFIDLCDYYSDEELLDCMQSVKLLKPALYYLENTHTSSNFSHSKKAMEYLMKEHPLTYAALKAKSAQFKKIDYKSKTNPMDTLLPTYSKCIIPTLYKVDLRENAANTADTITPKFLKLREGQSFKLFSHLKPFKPEAVTLQLFVDLYLHLQSDNAVIVLQRAIADCLQKDPSRRIEQYIEQSKVDDVFTEDGQNVTAFLREELRQIFGKRRTQMLRS